MKRCRICHRIIWPWQDYAFKVLRNGHRRTWHTTCARKMWDQGGPKPPLGWGPLTDDD